MPSLQVSLDQPSRPVAFLPWCSPSDASASLSPPSPPRRNPPASSPSWSLIRALHAAVDARPSAWSLSSALITVFSPALQPLGCHLISLQNLGISSCSQQGTWPPVGLDKCLLHCTLWLQALFLTMCPQSFHWSLPCPPFQEEYTPGLGKPDHTIGKSGFRS